MVGSNSINHEILHFHHIQPSCTLFPKKNLPARARKMHVGFASSQSPHLNQGRERSDIDMYDSTIQDMR